MDTSAFRINGFKIDVAAFKFKPVVHFFDELGNMREGTPVEVVEQDSYNMKMQGQFCLQAQIQTDERPGTAELSKTPYSAKTITLRSMYFNPLDVTKRVMAITQLFAMCGTSMGAFAVDNFKLEALGRR